MSGLRGLLCIALWLFCAPVVVADTQDPAFPALYRVTGVAADDGLHIRARPDAGSPSLGVFAPDASGIEVLALSREGRWGQVNYDERAGWVSMRFLAPMEIERGTLGLPRRLSCVGVEPFWSVRFEGSALVLDSDAQGGAFPITSMSPGAEFMDVVRSGALFTWDFQGEGVQARILPGRCNDTMSGNLFGLHYVDPVLGHGCCTLG